MQDEQGMLENPRQFDRISHPYLRHGEGVRGSDSDFEEGNVEDHAEQASNPFLHSTLFGVASRPIPPSQSQQSRPQPGTETDQTDRTFVLRRFQEMLTNDFQLGTTGRSGRNTLFSESPSDRPPTFVRQHHMTYTTGGNGGIAMSFSFGGSGAGSSGDSSPAPHAPFDQYDSSPSSSAETLPRILIINIRGTNSRPRMFNSLMGIGGPSIPIPQPATEATSGARVAPDLATILSTLLGSLAHPDGVHGDAVYTQEAMDRILSQLMEQNQGSNAPPPASQEVMDRLPRRRLDNEMLPEGSGECTICIQDVSIGDEVVVLPCTHWFHEECIMHWLREHGTCPVCRQAVDPHPEGSGGPNSSQHGSGTSPSSGADPNTGPGAGARGTGSSGGGDQAQGFSSPFHFATLTTTVPNSSPTRTQSLRSRPPVSDRFARLNAIRVTAGLSPETYEETHRRRSRSPHGSNGNRRRRHSQSFSRHQPSSTSATGTLDRTADRDYVRGHRANFFAVGNSSSPNSNNDNSHSGQVNEIGSNNDGPLLGWLRNTFQGRRS